MSAEATNKVTLTIDGQQVSVDAGTSIMNAAKQIGVEIPHFCYHDRLSVAGNCRMCLVDVEKSPKPVASCAMPAGEGMVVDTKSQRTINARKGVMEMLLINHPLDCPICDQGGECDLQDIAVAYGSDRTRFHEAKRAVADKNIGPLIKTVMTRCIHCTRCIRFATEVAGVEEMGATGRGENMEVGTYVESALESELSGNMIDLCPVGALTSKPYAFVARPWELKRTQSIDVMDALGSHIEIDHRDGKVMRITPQECDAINEEWISDTARFSYDGLTSMRLSSPMVRKGKKHEACGWPEAFSAAVAGMKKHAKGTVAGLADGIHCAEDLYAFNQFMKTTLGSDNVDGRTIGSKQTSENRASYIMNSTIAGIDEADAILLVGVNTRHEAPVLNARIRKAATKGDVPVGFIGAPVELTYPVYDLGTSPADIEKLLSSKSTFAKAFKEAKKPMIIVGGQALTQTGASALEHSLNTLIDDVDMVRADWNGFNVLHQKPGHITALDLGVYPQAKGKDAKATIKALKDGKVDVLVLYGEPDVPASKLAGAKFTIFIGTHNSPYAELADVVLPVAAYTEKTGLWTNIEGRVQEGKAAVLPPLHAKEDWKVFRALSEHLGKPLPFDTQAQLRAIIADDACEAYEKIGDIVPAEWEAIGKSGKLSEKDFAQPVEHFYLTNPILRASAVMQETQEIANERAEKIRQQMKKAS